MPVASAPAAMPSPAEALETALRAGGDLAMRHFGQQPKRWTKADGTPVSEADLAVDALLHEALEGIDARAGWLSEETADEAGRQADARCWIVDPIDGTSSFLKGGDNWSIVACLCDQGRPVLAGIYRPVSDDYYGAVAGHGAFLNGERLTASPRRRLEGARVITHRKVLEPERWPVPWPPVEAGMVTSLALRLCLVAEARFDAAFALAPKSDWDLAAGDLIVHEAGGRMSDPCGETLVYNRDDTRQSGFVAAGPVLHAEIIARTRAL